MFQERDNDNSTNYLYDPPWRETTSGWNWTLCGRYLARSSPLWGIWKAVGLQHSYILAEKPDEGDGHEERPYLTVLPLANSLGLKTADDGLDIRFKREESEQVAEAVKNFQGDGNILICWENKALTDLATTISVTNPPKYNAKHSNELWKLNAERNHVKVTEYSIPPDPAAATPETDGSK